MLFIRDHIHTIYTSSTIDFIHICTSKIYTLNQTHYKCPHIHIHTSIICFEKRQTRINDHTYINLCFENTLTVRTHPPTHSHTYIYIICHTCIHIVTKNYIIHSILIAIKMYILYTDTIYFVTFKGVSFLKIDINFIVQI